MSSPVKPAIPAGKPAWFIAGCGLIVLALAVSAVQPYDAATWLLEVLPVLIALPLLWWTRERHPLTPLLYGAIALHALVLIVGGHYTYARVPLGFDLQQWLGLQRNPYDRIGHLFQGLVPALIAREVLLRGAYIRTRSMLNFVVVCAVMFVSSVYELIEWGTALAFGQGAVEFLGTQGDPWDTQSDMFCALIGSLLSLLLLSRWQDRQLRRGS